MKINWDTYTYQELIETTEKMAVFNQELPNLDDLEVSTSKFNQKAVEKAKEQEISNLYERRA